MDYRTRYFLLAVGYLSLGVEGLLVEYKLQFPDCVFTDR